MRVARPLTAPICLLACLGLVAAGASADVRLRSRTITAAEGGAYVARTGSGTVTVVVAAAAAVRAEWIARLEAEGARLVTYLPERAFLVRIDGKRVAELAAVSGTAFIADWTPGDALAPELAAANAARAGEPVPLHLLVAPDLAPGLVADALSRLGLKVTGSSSGGVFNDVGALLPSGRLDLAEQAAALPGVIWIEPRARRVLLNDTSYWVNQGGIERPYVSPVFANGIFGAGQTVAVLDTGLDYDMCYFRDPAGAPPINQNGGTAFDPTRRKVVAYDFLWIQDNPANAGDWDDQNHGTHVAGSVAGDNEASPLRHDRGDGMAPAAKLVIQDGGYAVDNCADLPALGCPVTSLMPIFDQAYQQGARFHTNSWGDRENFTPQNLYTAGCVDSDDFMYRHPDFLILYAAGNEGAGNGTVGSPSVAKSTVSVGATNHGTASDSIAGFSSWGNAADGRLKPTVTAPGNGIISAANDTNINSNNCGVRSMSGTSMACPTAAGLAALAAEYYAAGYYPGGVRGAGTAFTPSAALVKATLVNSGRSMRFQTVIPSPEQGWGRITLDDTLVFPGDSRDLFVIDETAGFTTGAVAAMRYTVEVRSSRVPLKATLVWTDRPSNPMAATNLINDLDLAISGPSGTFLGNVFAAGASLPGGNPDRINVEEQILIPAPQSGSYTIEVRPAAVAMGPQPFALVLTADLPTPLVVVYAGMTIVSEGNNSGWPDPGETLSLAFSLRNSSDQAATQVTGTLRAQSSEVVVSDATASWPDIAAGATTLSLADHFAIQVAAGTLCGARVPMRLEVQVGGRAIAVDLTLLVGGYVEVMRESFDSTVVGQTPARVTVTSTQTNLGTAICDDTVEPVATSPGPPSPANALYIGKVAGTDTRATTSAARLQLDLGAYAGRPASLSFSTWTYSADGGERLVAALSSAGTTTYPWELLRTPTGFDSATRDGGRWWSTTVDLENIPPFVTGSDNWLRFDGTASVAEAGVTGNPGDAYYVDDVVLRAVTCMPACASSRVSVNSLRALKSQAAVDLSWAGTPTGFNLHVTTLPADLPALWMGTSLNPTPLAATGYVDPTPPSPIGFYRAYGTDSCTGRSVP